MRLVAEVLGQLRLHRPLHQPLGQLREHTARPDDLLLGPGAGEQLVDHLVGEAIADRVRELRAARRRQAAALALRARSAPRRRSRSGHLGLVFVDMTLLFRHAYTADRTLPPNLRVVVAMGPPSQTVCRMAWQDQERAMPPLLVTSRSVV